MKSNLIVHVFNSSVVSGPETLVIPALKKLEPEYRVAVIFLTETRLQEKSQEPPAYARKFGLDTYEIAVENRWDRLAISELKELFLKLDPWIIHSHEVKAAAYCVATQQKQAFQITTNHGVRAKKRLKLKFFEWLYVHGVMPKVDYVLTVCNSDAELLKNRGVDFDKILVHVNGKSSTKIEHITRDSLQKVIRKRWNFAVGHEAFRSESAFIIGIVGRLSIEKRHALIIESLAQIPRNQSIFLAIFGRGPLENQLRKLTKELAVDDRVIWMGYQPDIGNEMAGLDLLASVSEAEGLPINLIEAAWALTPVLATGIDGVLDLIPSNEYGNLIRVNEHPHAIANRIIEIKSEKKSAFQDAQTSKLQAIVQENFSETSWLNRLREIYTKFIE